jgi:hypothetical protein
MFVGPAHMGTHWDGVKALFEADALPLDVGEELEDLVAAAQDAPAVELHEVHDVLVDEPERRLDALALEPSP